MFGKVEIKSTEFELRRVNNVIATFKCNDSVSGVMHCPSNGPITIVLDGGYVLGEFHCEVCAIREISLLTINIEDADKLYGASYSRYKELYGIGASCRSVYA